MSSKLWGGRFEKKEMDPRVFDFTSSIDIDGILARYDCLGTKAHVEMLEKCGYVSSSERKDITGALDEFLGMVEKGTADLDKHEDVHSAVQSYVENKVPESAKKMHTGRSRNEQVVCDMRLYCKDAMKRIMGLIKELQRAIVGAADKFHGNIIPGYTHLNHAQPVLFSHLLMAYVEMLERDRERVDDALGRTDVSVMGSGALAGSALDLRRDFVSDKLGFGKVSANSIDSVSDRDFIAEFVFALSMTAVHLSRVSEDMILYSIPEFGFLDIHEDYCTGSSLMPQKKNADVLELVRGRAALVIGALNSLLVLLKGLPHAYNRDLQEDKRFLVQSVETVAAELDIMKGLVGTIELKKEAALGKLEDEFIYATDLAEHLVRKGMPFKEAHWTVGRVVRHCVEKGINISDLSISELKGFSDALDKDVYKYLNPEVSVKMKKTIGSTNPDLVKKEIESWKRKLR